MRRSYQITAGILFVLSLAIVVASLNYGFYTTLGPGAGFFPFWLGLLLGGLAVTLYVQAARRVEEPLPNDFIPDRQGALRFGAIVVSLVWSALAMEKVGFRLTMLVCFLFLLFTLGRQRMVVAVPIAVAGSFGIYVVFVQLLQITLPVGIFRF